LDVHQKNVTACLLTVMPNGERQKELRTFETMTDDLLALADWLVVAGCTHVAMESTGVYWKPIYNLLEGNFELFVVNAQHIKAVPGRKSDVRDAEWIADLLQHGLLRGRYIPDRPQRELRELTRYRTALVREQARELNRLEKVLEGANIKLGAVASTMGGRSVRTMLEALVAGTTDPAMLAELAKGVPPFVVLCCRLPTLLAGPKIPTSAPSITGSVPAGGRNVQPLQWPTQSSRSFTTSSAPDARTRNSAAISSMNAIETASHDDR
jgi:hypothetical protein